MIGEPARNRTGRTLAAERIDSLQAYWHEFHQLGARRLGLKGLVGRVFRAILRKAIGPFLESQATLNGHLVASISGLQSAWEEERACQLKLLGELSNSLAEVSARQAALESRAGMADRERAGARARIEEIAAVLGHEIGRLQGTLLPQMPTGVPYLAFEHHFRGPRELIKKRHGAYIPYFEDRGLVLDIGCGRGEFLELVQERGMVGRGLDLDPGMVEFCQNLGFDVFQGDAIPYIESLPDSSLGGVFMGQVIEHLSLADLGHLILVIASKLAPGGTFVAETVNPRCLRALANFFIDPTHVRPVHPGLAVFLADFAGLESVGILFSSPDGEAPPELFSTDFQPRGVETYMDYALIARKPVDGVKLPDVPQSD